jgi:glycosyltransferase involved in cell wall biosynthesis
VRFSIVIPARNESAWIGACLDAVRDASRPFAGDVETIVVLNRCSDDTGAVASAHGARTVEDDSRNLAKIRNTGARHASGDILVTVDADSVMSPNMLEEADRAMRSGKYIGGGVPIRPERMSLGILLSGLLILCALPLGISAGLFWCYRRDFKAIGGFDESLVIAEDVDFAKRLKSYGRQRGKRFGTLWRTRITTSCRKFDRFGDWFLLKRPGLLLRAVRGQDRGLADRLFYDFER